MDPFRRTASCLAILFLGAAWPALAAAQATPAPADTTQPAEDLDHFHAACRLTAPGGAQATVPCLSQDLPDPAFENRWQYELGPEARAFVGDLIGQPAIYVRVNGGALAEGAMVQDLEGVLHMHLKPANAKVAGRFRELAPASEARWQWVTVSAMAEGYVRILIEEPR